jgi:hypothetical protein
MGRKVDVLIEITNGIIEDVAVLPRKEANEVWRIWGHEHGYSNYHEFIDAVRAGQVVEELRWFGDIDIDEGFKIKYKKEFNPSVRGNHEINR